jgi:hypothetical protein
MSLKSAGSSQDKSWKAEKNSWNLKKIWNFKSYSNMNNFGFRVHNLFIFQIIFVNIIPIN